MLRGKPCACWSLAWWPLRRCCCSATLPDFDVGTPGEALTFAPVAGLLDAQL